jgi:hypothetical protein
MLRNRGGSSFGLPDAGTAWRVGWCRVLGANYHAAETAFRPVGDPHCERPLESTSSLSVCVRELQDAQNVRKPGSFFSRLVHATVG